MRGKHAVGVAGAFQPVDHPRVCGENLPDFKFSGDVKGSPPRMRGKHLNQQFRQRNRRITPAYAGKTHSNSFASIKRWDHPRVCGENLELRFIPCNSVGSPPRMRGKLVVLPYRDSVNRITPAYAGKTTGSRGCTQGKRDHPRVCGENRLHSK